MRRKTTLIIIFALLLTNMLNIASNVQHVEAGPPKTIRVPTDYPTIQEAIDHADPGDTIIVSEGMYEEGQINVTTSLSLLANGSVIVDGLRVGHVFYVIASNVTINGFIIKNSSIVEQDCAGILIEQQQNCNVSNNKITNNWSGIRLVNSSYNAIAKNNVTNNLDYGICIFPHLPWKHSFGNNINENTVTNNTNFGILLEYSGGNRLKHNVINGSGFNFGVYGYIIQDFINDIDTSNKVNGKPIYFLKNQQNISINPSTFQDIGYLGVVNSTNIIVEGLNLTNNIQGVLLAYTNSSRVVNNTLSNNEVNIDLTCDVNCQVKDNNITYSGNGGGIWVHNSNDSKIWHNHFINNTVQV